MRTSITDTVDPAELHTHVVQLLDAVATARHQLKDIRHAYAALDPGQLGVDDLGSELAAADCIATAQRAFLAVGGALATVSDSVHDAMRHTSRLKATAV
ncbi:hypothetical protein [Tsukamurella tyrosinosolvens]|uniref:hypothetical protein n=1 Tax=Tsukamurella tyrosinosolvens TaxID=57704 RepID=UPI000791E97A|nr:hypothetical protein [Tsukamurella tyrosinosolvens]KXO99659.1 hypothetical protein AXK58_00045 [Tsukamurella tyrosinosolvens]